MRNCSHKQCFRCLASSPTCARSTTSRQRNKPQFLHSELLFQVSSSSVISTVPPSAWKTTMFMAWCLLAVLSTSCHASTTSVTMAAGAGYNCALTQPSGAVRCWGWNANGETGLYSDDLWVTSVPAEPVLTGVDSLATGHSHVCALSRSGGLKCWGSAFHGEVGYTNLVKLGCGEWHMPCLPSPPTADTLSEVVSVTAGSSFTCVIMRVDAGVRCWGNNWGGQLGTGDDVDRLAPPSTSVLTDALLVSAGEGHVCALLKSSHGVRCWGANDLGQLGIGAAGSDIADLDLNSTLVLDNLNAPPAHNIADNVTNIFAGGSTTCIISGDERGLRCFGANQFGQAGNGGKGLLCWTFLCVPYVPEAEILIGVRSVAVGGYHVCALMEDGGSVLCWGQNLFGTLGNGGTGDVLASDIPSIVTDGGTLFVLSPPVSSVINGAAHVAAGVDSTCVVMADTNGIRCWGYNDGGQLGLGPNSTVEQLYTPPMTDTLLLEDAITFSPSKTVSHTTSQSPSVAVDVTIDPNAAPPSRGQTPSQFLNHPDRLAGVIIGSVAGLSIVGALGYFVIRTIRTATATTKSSFTFFRPSLSPSSPSVKPTEIDATESKRQQSYIATTTTTLMVEPKQPIVAASAVKHLTATRQCTDNNSAVIRVSWKVDSTNTAHYFGVRSNGLDTQYIVVKRGQTEFCLNLGPCSAGEADKVKTVEFFEGASDGKPGPGLPVHVQ